MKTTEVVWGCFENRVIDEDYEHVVDTPGYKNKTPKYVTANRDNEVLQYKYTTFFLFVEYRMKKHETRMIS